MSSASATTEADARLTLRLTVEQLAIIVAHLEVGRYCEVAAVLQNLLAQAAPQLTVLAQLPEPETSSLEAEGARGVLQ